jgi:hypothetical protein
VTARVAWWLLVSALVVVAAVLMLLPHEVHVLGQPYECGPAIMAMVPRDPGSDQDRAALTPCHNAIEPYGIGGFGAILLAAPPLFLALRSRS